MFTHNGGLFDKIGGIFKTAVKTVTSIPKASLGLVTSTAKTIGQTAGNIGGSIIKGLGITSISIPGLGGATFAGAGGGGGGGGGISIPAGTQVTTKVSWILPVSIGAGLLVLFLLFKGK